MKNPTPANNRSIWSVALFLLTICASIPLKAQTFPESKKQIDASEITFGTGTCLTKRVGVWLADGGVVVEIKKPLGVCMFETLDFVVDGERIRSTMVDKGFYSQRRSSANVLTHEWYRGDSGKVFFATQKTIDPGKIQGIFETSCGSRNCLYEDTARP